MKRSYIGRINGGRIELPPTRRERMAVDLATIKDGRQVEITIQLLPRRSNPQNAFYWAVCVPMIQQALQDLGHEVNELQAHELLKSKFNPKDVITPDGELIGQIGGSTTELSTVDFMEYVEKIQRWAAQYLNIAIPDPNSNPTLF